MDRAKVRTEQGYQTTVTTDNHLWHSDTSIEGGGTDKGPNPEEMLLGALGSCTVMTLHMYANRKQWNLQRVEVDLELEKHKATDYPAYEGDAGFVNVIQQDIRLTGDLDEKQRARLMEIAGKCPVNRVISGPTFIEKQEITAEPQ